MLIKKLFLSGIIFPGWLMIKHSKTKNKGKKGMWRYSKKTKRKFFTWSMTVKVKKFKKQNKKD